MLWYHGEWRRLLSSGRNSRQYLESGSSYCHICSLSPCSSSISFTFCLSTHLSRVGPSDPAQFRLGATFSLSLPIIGLNSIQYSPICFCLSSQRIVIDCRGHLLGRLAATIAKELLAGQHIVCVRTEGIVISGPLSRNKCM